ncbi:hypothetical protein ACFSJU_07545 [Paradesertivirga mongoliensis]|uniref:Uncharacterized protein n=1 Tax=Paradesertivirga mongoliensis TaxID=2100740 RepID=A0ABW4ZK46_9SPHI|nr:hypothetical protein [Pedobacter mongoliensis]
MGKKITFYALYVITMLLCVIFSRFLYEKSWFSVLTVSKELVPFDVFSLIVSSILTFWLAWFITKRLTEQRYEKEYLISDLKIIEEDINKIEDSTTEDESIELQKLLNNLNRLYSNITRFSKTMDAFEVQNFEVQPLRKCYNRLFTLLTDVDGEYLLINDVNRHEINQLCSEFVLTARKMVFEINKR